MAKINPETAPSTQERTYGAADLFFSTTDRAGRIERANSTFMRLSGYPRGALVGQPHNVVRHEDMPAGLFRHIWNNIEEGLTASAYITNRASTGEFYRVFATVVPAGEGYLSIRTLPMLTELRGQMEEAYARVREAEAASRAAGANSREIAAAGAAALTEQLQAAGYKDVTAFTRQVLPAEVAALVDSGVGVPLRPDATGPVAVVLEEMNGIEQATLGLVSLLDAIARLVALLQRQAEGLAALQQRLGELREQLRTLIGFADLDDAELAAAYERTDALALECWERLRPLPGQVEALGGDTDSVRFAIALLRLHNLAAGFFAVQLLDGEDHLEANDAVGSLGVLTRALHAGAQSLSQRIDLYEARAELVGGELDEVAEALAGLHAPLGDLLDNLADSVGEGAGAPALARARELADLGFWAARDVAELAGAVRDLEVPDVSEEVDTHVDRVREAMAQLQ